MWSLWCRRLLVHQERCDAYGGDDRQEHQDSRHIVGLRVEQVAKVDETDCPQGRYGAKCPCGHLAAEASPPIGACAAVEPPHRYAREHQSN